MGRPEELAWSFSEVRYAHQGVFQTLLRGWVFNGEWNRGDSSDVHPKDGRKKTGKLWNTIWLFKVMYGKPWENHRKMVA